MEIVLRPFEPGDEAAFRDLNEAWIQEYFSIEGKDSQVLGDPVRHILQEGGSIYMALQGGKPAGCCALVAAGEGCLELAKMAVDKDLRGSGIGRKLLVFVVEQARQAGATRLFLETNHTLEAAIHLYEAVGFSRIPADRGHVSPYARSDVAMEMVLRS